MSQKLVEPKSKNQTKQITVLYDSLKNQSTKKSKIYDLIMEKLPNVPRPTIRRAINAHLGYKPQPKTQKKETS